MRHSQLFFVIFFATPGSSESASCAEKAPNANRPCFFFKAWRGGRGVAAIGRHHSPLTSHRRTSQLLGWQQEQWQASQDQGPDPSPGDSSASILLTYLPGPGLSCSALPCPLCPALAVPFRNGRSPIANGIKLYNNSLTWRGGNAVRPQTLLAWRGLAWRGVAQQRAS